MAKGLRLNDPSELRDWLKDKPAAWSHIIAIRIALRMLPMIGRAMKLEKKPRGNDYRATLVTSVFRACCLSWTAHKFPSRDIIAAATFAADDAAAAADDADAAYAYADADAYAAYAAAAAADAAADAYAYAYAAYAADAYAAAADAADAVDILKQIARDAAWLESQGKADNSSHAARLAEQPLWYENAPQLLQTDWQTFKSSPFAADSGYDPWIRWYEAVAPFDPQTPPRDLFSDNLTKRIATQSNEWWRRPAMVINTNIARWLAEEEGSSEPPTEDLPAQLTEALDQLPGQQPAPYQFDWRDGRIEVLPPDALPEDGGLAQDYLDEAREKADTILADPSGNNIKPDIHPKVRKLREALTDLAADLRPARVDSRTITIEKLVGELRHSPEAADLPSHVLRDLDDLAETARRLCRRLPGLWKDDVEAFADSLTPNSAARLLTKLNALHDGIRNAEIIGPDVVAAFDALADECAEAADEILKKFRTAMYGVTVRNFLDALLHSGKQASSAFANELIRLSKDVHGVLRSEFVKLVAQGIIIGGVSITGCAALYVMNVGSIREIARSFPMLEKICNLLDMIAPDTATPHNAPPPAPSAPPRTARPTSDKGPTRSA